MENTNPIQVLKDRIIAWEHKAGESFTDYFMHDNVAPRSWAFWLLGKGITSHANKLIEDAVRHTQSPLNTKLTDLLVRLQALNTKLIDTTDTVTL